MAALDFFLYVKDSRFWIENVVGKGKISVSRHQMAPTKRAIVLPATNYACHLILIPPGRDRPSGKPDECRTRRK